MSPTSQAGDSCGFLIVYKNERLSDVYVTKHVRQSFVDIEERAYAKSIRS